MKKLAKKYFAFVCASFLAGAVFAQNTESENSLAETYESERKISAEKPSELQIISMSESTKEISLFESDWNNSIPSLSVPGYSSRDLKWTSSNKKVVKVDMKGRLFPKSLGKAVITAETPDGKKAECEVEITKYGPKPSSAGMALSTGLTGDASVTWGFDMDTGRSGFTTDQNIKLKMDILNLGEVWLDEEEGLPLWGEIRIFTKGDPLRYMVDADSGTALYENKGDFKILVDRAKVHFGNGYLTVFDKEYSDLGYVNYTTGSDVAFSFMAADTTKRRYGKLTKRNLHTYLSSFDENATVWGAAAGYEMPKVFKVQADVASTMRWIAGSSDSTQDSADLSKDATDYLVKVSGEFNMIPDLSLQAGFSSGILGEDSTVKHDLRLGGEAEYEWNFYDIYYLKPSVGLTMIQKESTGSLYPLFSAGLLLGWEDEQDAFDYWDCKYSKDDYGPYPGLAFAIQYADSALAENCTIFSASNTLDTFNDDMMILHASFNTGNDLLVKNLEAVGAVDVINLLSDRCVMGYTLGAAYTIPLGAHGFSVKPKALVTRYHDTFNDSNDYCFVKGGFEIGYQKVTLKLEYESNDLINGFDNGEKLTKMGKFETTVKVSF